MSQSTPTLDKNDLKALIERAAQGNQDAAKKLVSPFISSDEKLLEFGLSAKLGLIKTYDFVFLTDRCVGDLEVTPLNGNLNVEVAYLQKIDAYVLNQPAFPLGLRFSLIMLYPGMAYLAFAFSHFLVVELLLHSRSTAHAVGILSILLALVATHFAFIPAIKRGFLRFKKSGL